MPSTLQSSLRTFKQWWQVRLGDSPLPSDEKGMKLPALWIDCLRLAGVFLGVLILTGILLSLNYEPSARPLSQNGTPMAMARALKTVVVNSDTLYIANEMLLLPIRAAGSVQFPDEHLSNIQIMRDEQGQILTANAATVSIEQRIMQQIPFGAIIRGVHIVSVHCFIGCLVIAFVMLFFRRGYRAPLELIWLQTIGIIVVALFSAFTGHILPWNMLAYISGQIVFSAASYLPFGETVATILRGGVTLQPATLPRMFIIHSLICPFVMVLMLRSVFRLAGKLGDIGRFSRLSYISLAGITIIILVLISIAVEPFGGYSERLPVDLSKAVSGASALAPSWYFLPEFQILRVFPIDFAMLILGVWCCFWLLLPFVGVSSHRKRIAMWISGAVLLIFIVVFGIGGLLK